MVLDPTVRYEIYDLDQADKAEREKKNLCIPFLNEKFCERVPRERSLDRSSPNGTKLNKKVHGKIGGKYNPGHPGNHPPPCALRRIGREFAHGREVRKREGRKYEEEYIRGEKGKKGK
ncbi:unnamed protein product [Nezara viridula]|uniref:Uncharacterized protein n=1 Tax=Nezara viridula TaxID=85310 RepID=A0A9P0HKG2_NEZVI|nr:unnamed protein product [Nezara viridula]